MKKVRRLLLLLPMLALPAGAAAQQMTYCCVDGSGARICGDTLPPACFNRAYRVVAPSGRTVREVEAPLTPEQRARREAEQRAQREQTAREAEAKRRDQVLLDSYSSVTEIDVRRDREVTIIEAEMKQAKAREADLLASQAKLEKLKPASGPVPRDVAVDLDTVASELRAVRSVMASKQRDIDNIRNRFAQDRKRYVELMGQPGTNPGASR